MHKPTGSNPDQETTEEGALTRPEKQPNLKSNPFLWASSQLQAASLTELDFGGLTANRISRRSGTALSG